jgi:hypothetical protein
VEIFFTLQNQFSNFERVFRSAMLHPKGRNCETGEQRETP